MCCCFLASDWLNSAARYHLIESTLLSCYRLRPLATIRLTQLLCLWLWQDESEESALLFRIPAGGPVLGLCAPSLALSKPRCSSLHLSHAHFHSALVFCCLATSVLLSRNPAPSHLARGLKCLFSASKLMAGTQVLVGPDDGWDARLGGAGGGGRAGHAMRPHLCHRSLEVRALLICSGCCVLACCCAALPAPSWLSSAHT